MNKSREITSIRKASRIIDLFNINRKELSISDINKELKFSRSSIYYILRTLEIENYIQKNQDNNKYRLGIKFLKLGNLFKEHTEIRYYAFSAMQDLHKNTKESVYLNTRIGENRVGVEKIDSPYSVRSIIPLGKSFPLYQGASGRAILAFLDERKRDKYLQIYKKNEDFNIDFVSKELDKTRRLFYNTSFEEIEIGAAAVASPIFDHDGKVIGSITVAGSNERIKNQNLKCIIKNLKDAGMKISFSLGYDKYIEEKRVKNPYL